MIRGELDKEDELVKAGVERNPGPDLEVDLLTSYKRSEFDTT
jgi:hypothetical protein